MCLSGECRLGHVQACVMNIVQFFALSIAIAASSVKAEIRCYCNQPTCVSTGYMCKSNSGMCFTELFSYGTDLSKSRHGCVELLKPEKRSKCVAPTTQVANFPVVFCCKEDMCNYMSSMDINILVNTRRNISKVSGAAYDLNEERRAYEAALQQDVWFKAAVIAVPIAGGFILILLILLATRMLRQDSRRQRQLLELRRQQRMFGKPHILVAQPCCRGRPAGPNCKQDLPCGHTNLSMSRDSWYIADSNAADRRYLYEKSHDGKNSVYAALLPWTKWNHAKSSTHV